MLKLDQIDLSILATLQAEGRITQHRLAEVVGLSPSACHQRLKRLEAVKLVRGYHAEVDIGRLVSTVTAFVPLELRKHEEDDFRVFEGAIVRCPEVLECYALGGGFDYLLKIVTSDIATYQAVIDRLLGAGIGIVRYYTYVVTKLVKQQHGYPLRELLGAEQAPSRPVSIGIPELSIRALERLD